MNFSEVWKQSGQLTEFSPDGSLLAYAYSNKLQIRGENSMNIVRSFTCVDNIGYIQWSSDSNYLLCCLFKQNLIQVWSISDPEWTCKIDEGSSGLQEATWSPDSRHILSTSSFHLKITVWSLMNKSVDYIKYSKAANPGLDFTKDGKYLAVAERRHCKDYISIFICSSWQLIKHFESETSDLAGISWSPRELVLCVWDAPLEEYMVLLYSINGNLLGSYSAYKWTLGIRCVSWSPSGQFLAVGSYDNKLRLLNTIICKKIMEFETPSTISSSSFSAIYVEKTSSKSNQKFSVTLPRSYYEQLEDFPFVVPSVVADATKSNQKHGVKQTAFSCDNRYVYVINDSTPNICWIYDVEKLALASALVQINAIKCLDWHPHESKLALGTANCNLYMWSPSSCLAVQIPHDFNFQVSSLRWNIVGKSIILGGKGTACTCYLS